MGRQFKTEYGYAGGKDYDSGTYWCKKCKSRHRWKSEKGKKHAIYVK